MLFPDFTGFSPLDWPFFVARLGRKKYRSVARMIFFSPTKPEGPPCTKNAIQDLCLVKTEKHRLHCQSQSRSRFVGRTKKGCKPAGLHPFCAYILLPVSFSRLAGTENLVRNLSGKVSHFLEKDFRREFSPLHARQPGFPARSECGVIVTL